MKNRVMKIFIFIISATILIFLDQVSKRIAVRELSSGKVVSLIPNILEFTYVENTGAAFGILKNQKILFTIITVIVIGLIFYFLLKIKFNMENMFNFIILILLFSGAIGNFIDRIKNSYVVDFIYFKPINFPVFNLADTYITIACFMLIISMFVFKDATL